MIVECTVESGSNSVKYIWTTRYQFWCIVE